MEELLPILNKKQVKELEETTIRIENIVIPTKKKTQQIFEYMFKIQTWYHQYNIHAGSFVAAVSKLKELLGNPIYYVTHRDRNALWAFMYKEYPVLIYRSKRGMALQVVDNFPKEEVIPFLCLLIKKLYK